MSQIQQIDQLILQHQIRQFAETWRAMLDSHAPAEERWRILADWRVSQHSSR